MYNELPHQNLQMFGRSARPALIERVIDRHELKIPDQFAPYAREFGVASAALLSQIGYCPGMGPLTGWHRNWVAKCFTRDFAALGKINHRLMVFPNDETGLWWIERFGAPRIDDDFDEVLAFTEGRLPILTSSAAAAMRLAVESHESAPPLGIGWIKVTARANAQPACA